MQTLPEVRKRTRPRLVLSPERGSERSSGPRSLAVHNVRETDITLLRPYGRNSRSHTDRQIALIAESIRDFGFVNPILIDRENTIIAGHGRWEAARLLKLSTVPTVLLDHLTPQQVRAYRIADNRLAELSEWNRDMLRLEISELVELDLAGELEFDLPVLGFDTPALDVLLASDAAEEPRPERVDLSDSVTPAVTRTGDLWRLGPHRIICGSSLDAATVSHLMEGERARLVFTDPPYNVRISGHVRASGRHREFAMASGEMTEAQFREFLSSSLAGAAAHLADDGMLMVCMDWRHIGDLTAVGSRLGLPFVNLIVWVKTNGGMGSLWRSQHELIAVFGSGRGRHLNNVELGRHGRYRTNVWQYAGVNTFRRGRAADLADHPTVKPTALMADAIRDVTRHGDIVFDGFGGSGTTLLAAGKTARRARLVEIDPAYVDVTIRRWQAMTGEYAVCAMTGTRFDDRAAEAASQGVE